MSTMCHSPEAFSSASSSTSFSNMTGHERVAEATDHLVSVARCPIVADCLTGRTPDHPCAKLVLSQWPAEVSQEDRAEAWRRWHQLPEPWAGHLREARLLFVASNPGLRRKIETA